VALKPARTLQPTGMRTAPRGPPTPSHMPRLPSAPPRLAPATPTRQPTPVQLGARPSLSHPPEPHHYPSDTRIAVPGPPPRPHHFEQPDAHQLQSRTTRTNTWRAGGPALQPIARPGESPMDTGAGAGRGTPRTPTKRGRTAQSSSTDLACSTTTPRELPCAAEGLLDGDGRPRYPHPPSGSAALPAAHHASASAARPSAQSVGQSPSQQQRSEVVFRPASSRNSSVPTPFRDHGQSR